MAEVVRMIFTCEDFAQGVDCTLASIRNVSSAGDRAGGQWKDRRVFPEVLGEFARAEDGVDRDPAPPRARERIDAGGGEDGER